MHGPALAVLHMYCWLLQSESPIRQQHISKYLFAEQEMVILLGMIVRLVTAGEIAALQ